MIKMSGGGLMADQILEKMKKGVYYPGNHLGKKQKLKDLVDKGYLHRMDGSFLCGPNSEPNFRLTDKGILSILFAKNSRAKRHPQFVPPPADQSSFVIP